MLQKISGLIDRGNRFLITTHIDPDGDAIGSAFALAWALVSLNKDPLVYLKDPIPYMYEFLRKPQAVTSSLARAIYDAVFAVDCGSLSRVGAGHEALKEMGTIVNIDHHVTNETFGAVNLVDADASSSAEILYRLFKVLEVPFTLDIAINIYTAIFTDTGSFRYSNTTSEAFLICERMTRCGVSPSYVSQMVHENHPKERFLLLGRVLKTLETYDHDSVALAYITRDMFATTHTSREHAEGFVEYLREIRGVEVAILVRELSEKEYKISMRSKGRVNVAAICNLFGGGGHRNAAGCRIRGSRSQVRDQLKEALKAA